MDGGDHPRGPYAALIGRLTLGHPVGDREIDKLPDPELFRDAVFLAGRGTFSPSDLDGMDALLLALITKLTKAKRR